MLRGMDDLDLAVAHLHNTIEHLPPLAQEALRDALKEISGFVQGISKGDKALILSAGFDVVKPRTKLQTPESPKDLKVQRTVERGILKVKWTRVSCSKLSYLEMAEKGSDAWQRIHTTRNSHVMTNLQTGTEYCFRTSLLDRRHRSDRTCS